MLNHDYHFVSRWRVVSTPAEVYEIIDNATDLTRWWPSVYLEVVEVEPGDARGIGKVLRLHTKGLLPYTLRWQFRVVEKSPPYRLALEAFGDLTGRGVWNFTADGSHVDIAYDWRIRADKPLLRYLSFLLRPVFAANHRWAMAQGEKSLKQELVRRHQLMGSPT